jgi:hypothetical protein
MVLNNSANSPGLALEDLHIAPVVIDVDGLHPLEDAPGEAGPLVAPEVEVPPLVDVVQQCFQLAVFSGGRHRISIGPGGAASHQRLLQELSLATLRGYGGVIRCAGR